MPDKCLFLLIHVSRVNYVYIYIYKKIFLLKGNQEKGIKTKETYYGRMTSVSWKKVLKSFLWWEAEFKWSKDRTSDNKKFDQTVLLNENLTDGCRNHPEFFRPSLFMTNMFTTCQQIHLRQKLIKLID